MSDPAQPGAQATFTTSALTAGTHTITATYNGSADYLPSTTVVQPGSPRVAKPLPRAAAPAGVVADAAGNVYVVDSNNDQLLELSSDGTPSTLVTGLASPWGVARDSAGDLFIADTGNNQILEMTSTGAKSVVAGLFSSPEGIAVDSHGNLFVADSGNDQVLEVVIGIAEIPVATGLSSPTGVALDSAGDVFIADTGHDQVLEVPPSGPSKTIGTGLSLPQGVAVDAAGDVFIADTGNNRVVEVNPLGTQTVIATGLSSPTGVAVGPAGSVVVTSTPAAAPARVSTLSPGLAVTVTQATPTLTWATPANIISGTPLGATQLDATASVPGTFSYTPAAGTTLAVGQNEKLSVTFTPTDTTDYTSVTASQTINVTNPPPVITSEQPLFQRKMKHGKPVGNPILVGYMIDFSSKLNTSSADLPSNYEVDLVVIKAAKKKKITVLQPLTGFTVLYNEANESVRLTFTSQQTFKNGGRITLLGGPLNGVTSSSGAFLTGNRTLAISPGGKRITPA